MGAVPGLEKALGVRVVIITARGDGTEWDVVSRYFAPGLGIPEDPVTGAAHAQVAPLWAQRLGRDELLARQASSRGDTVRCRVAATAPT